MKYVTLIVWMLVLGEVLGYIASALESTTFQPGPVAIWTVIVGTLGTLIFTKISSSASESNK